MTRRPWHAPGILRGPAVLVLGACVLGCAASAPADPPLAFDPDDGIRHAKREMALLLHWSGPPGSPAVEEALGRTLQDALRQRYRAPVKLVRSSRPYRGLEPELLAELATRRVDDAVVLEVRAPSLGEPFRARARVIVLVTQAILHDLPVSEPPGRTDDPIARARRFARRIQAHVARRWVEPGRAPAMNPLRAANALFERGACAHALPIYDAVLRSSRPPRTDLITAHTEALRRRRLCRERLALVERIERDAEAGFALEQRVELPEPLPAAIAQAVKEVDLAGELREHTDKPVRVRWSRAYLSLTLRHRPGRAGQPRLDRSRPWAAVDLGPVRPLLEAMIDARERAAELAPTPDLSALVRRLGFELRLEHLDGDAMTLRFADLDGRPVFDRRLTVAVADTTVELRARLPELLREDLFVLGPLVDGRRRPTQDALAARFLESEPLAPELLLPR